MKVLKFGGSSLARPDRIQGTIDIILSCNQQETGTCQAVVVSALGGVTNTLVKAAELASSGVEPSEQLVELKTRHYSTLSTLIPAQQQSEYLVELKLLFNELEETLGGLKLVRELTPRLLDKVMGFGELLSARIVSAALNTCGCSAEFLDTRAIIHCDDHHGAGRVDLHTTYDAIRRQFRDKTTLQVATGFIASSSTGATITLGRGGSDYTATLIGAALDVSEIQVWTDVDGFMTADPHKVPNAFSQDQISYQEALELSHFGAKVIHPPALQPAIDRQIPIKILNSFNPTAIGTEICMAPQWRATTITGISSISAIVLIRLQGGGMMGVAGIAQRLFGALADADINVILITQASSEHSICCAIQPADATRAEQAINSEFELEIQAKLIEPVILENNLSILSVIGENMRHAPGMAGRLFNVLGRNGVNVNAIAQGSSELNISAVVTAHNETKALRVVHDEFFFPDTRTINIFLVGTGLIGNALLKQLVQHHLQLAQRRNNVIRLIGLTNSRNMYCHPEGLKLSNLEALLKSTARPADIDQFIAEMKRFNLPNSVFVDCTASSEVASRYPEILRSSISIVTPNKKAQTGDQHSYSELKALATRRGIQFLYESSVGAGLPIISTLNDLILSGDEIVSIEAVLSGTLSYLFNSFHQGLRFSEIVAQARLAGYTEPDPRIDLSGIDVARKILILARECGYALELEDVEVESLIPESCYEASSVEQFMELLPQSDDLFETRLKQAVIAGHKLCYIAKLEAGRASVTLEEIDALHPFDALTGNDNIVSFTTQRYAKQPLVIRGPGAGAEVTAAGVFADILRLNN